MQAVQDAIDQRVTIAAPLERVWTALTDAEQLKSWFSTDGCKVDLRVGGEIHFHWAESIGRATILALEPPSRFVWSWVPGMLEDPDLSLDQQPQTTVEFVLEATADGQTVVSSRETGFAAMSAADRDRAFSMNVEGWGFFFDSLKKHLEV